ncbi:metallophosphoesterase [Capnocytophaga sp.]|uniref:metallophosphoesterase family protein n=1 Tax=Capnocytophaga sp. TaxID=44737 RepID=UPI0026DD55B1|nr:metallophosphoesterase family protein [Capnocytophaga sp.]MDO5105663.1 metallophosphoesterase family protein [Capnocytophaga sp.]
MKKILLLSDTHAYMDERILAHAEKADEVWHCGDFGSVAVIEELQKIKPLRGVYGNIDGADIRRQFPEVNRFVCEQTEVLMLHIGGYPKKYSPLAKSEILKKTPKIFISGHSHILKVMYDPDYKLLHLNPGAVGKYGWQKVRTMLQFEIDATEIKNLQIIEFEK